MDFKTMQIDGAALETMASAIHYKRSTTYLRFFSNDARMELLLTIWQHERDHMFGINEYVCALSTSPQTDSSMYLLPVVGPATRTRQAVTTTSTRRVIPLDHLLMLVPVDVAGIDIASRP